MSRCLRAAEVPLRRARHRLWLRIPGSTRGSKRRNLLSYYILFVALLLMFDTYAAYFDYRIFPGVITAFALCAISFVYFYETTIAVVLLMSRNFEIAPVRLLRDIGISALYTILAFAVLYRALGLEGPDTAQIRPLDHIYFSAVTFSTLGYGDFSPAPPARIWASIQALFGNLHLGMIVGAFYLTIEVFRRRADED
ncbi:MAG: ion channel [Pikeienuella sp.]